MLQRTQARAYDYEMPPLLVGALVKRSTWMLCCRDCERVAYPNVVDLVGRFGDRFDSGLLWARATCRACGGRMRVCGGMFVARLQADGALHRMVMPARCDGPPAF